MSAGRFFAPPKGVRKAQRGFTYMAFLLFVALLGAGLAAYGRKAI